LRRRRGASTSSFSWMSHDAKVSRWFPGRRVITTTRHRAMNAAKRVAPIPFFLVNGYVIDIPRTLFSLRFSPRLGRLREIHGLPESEFDTLDLNMQNILIERFFHNLTRFIDIDRNIEDKEVRFHVGTETELPAIIKTGQSPTFTLYR
jgi:hypothetical protein